jgi:AraC-like DNA-binding protein
MNDPIRRDAGTNLNPVAATPRTSPLLAFSTAALPVAQQAEAWRAGNAPSLDVAFDKDRPAGKGFLGEREVMPFGPFIMTRVAAQSLTSLRTQRHARRDGLDHWCLNITTRGSRRFRLDRGDRCMTVPAGQVHIQALDEAYVSAGDDLEWIGVFFPRDSLSSLAAHLDTLRDGPRSGALAPLLARHLTMLWPLLPSMTPEERTRTADATAALIRASTASGGLAAPGENLPAVHRALAMTFIRRHLGSSRLTPDAVARALGMSRSSLYRAFEPDSSVAHVIQEERLKLARRLLSKAEERRGVREIAESVGIYDPSSFSRMFRRRFGVTPTDMRAAIAADGKGLRTAPRIALADFLW